MYPLASILRHGGKVTLGSDYPVSWIGKDALNPMFNIEMAVTPGSRLATRKCPCRPESVSAERGTSSDPSAYFRCCLATAFRRSNRRTLEVGKLADIVVLDRDPLCQRPLFHPHDQGRLHVFRRASRIPTSLAREAAAVRCKDSIPI